MRPLQIVRCALAGLLFVTAWGWCATTQPAQTQQAGKLTAKVLAVKGTARVLQGDGNTWVPLKVGDVLTAPAEISTGIRNSAVRIQLHSTAVILVRGSTRVALTELARLPNAEKVRLFLHRGTIRAGIVEEKVRSDFQIACPAAVLTREGTWGIEMQYDPASGDYYVGLDTEGLVRVMDEATGRRVGVYPGQYTTQTITRWTQTAAFNRMVSLVDQFGTTRVEKVLYANNSGGLSGLDPTGGRSLMRVVVSAPTVVSLRRQMTIRRARRQATRIVTDILNPPDGQPRTVLYRFGNFGTHNPTNGGSLFTAFRKARQGR